MGINLLTLHLDEKEALKTITDLENKYQLPVTDLVRFGDRSLIDKIVEEIS